MLLLGVLVFIACAPDATVAPSVIGKVEILEAPSTLYVGDQALLGVSVVDDRGQVLSAQPVAWRSSDSAVATVAGGRVVGIASGSTLISAEVGGKSATVRIDVRERVSSVVVSPPNPTMRVGGSLTLTATLLDRNGDTLSGRPITWSVPDSAVIGISGQGVVVAKGYTGAAIRSAVVAASAEGKSGTVTILVSPLGTSVVHLSVPSAELLPGQEFQLTAEPRDSLGNPLSGRVIAWSTSDTTVATVSSDGRTRATMYRGPVSRNALVRATIEGRTGEMTLAVRPLPVARVQIDVDSVRLLTADSLQVSATLGSVTGEVLFGRTVTWRILDTTVATVSSSGLLRAANQVDGAAVTTRLIAESEGRADTVTVRIGSRIARLEIVNDRTLLLVGDTLQLVSRAFGADGSEILGGFVRWSTANEAVLRVSASGLVTATGGGRTSVFAVSEGSLAVTEIVVTSVAAQRRTITAGDQHTCAIAETGETYCWGLNNFGQLGSAGPSSNVPRLVDGGHSFVSLAAGRMTTCGLHVDGRVLCWGNPVLLADGSAGARSMPGEIAGGRRYVSVAAGDTHACAITGEGELYCWGYNDYGMIGDGAPSASLASEPRRVLGGHRFRAVAAGFGHTCAVTVEQRVLCWGWNSFGQLGNGTEVNHYLPGPISSAESFVGTSAGQNFSCALSAAEKVLCWGRNDVLQTGSFAAGAVYGPTPVLRVSGTAVQPLAGIVALQSNPLTQYSCGLDSFGALFCWGSAPDRTTPSFAEPVASLSGIRAFATGASHACAIDQKGDAYCWGYLVEGQLGAGAELRPGEFFRRTPAKVSGGIVFAR